MVHRCFITGNFLPRNVPMIRIDTGGSRIVFSWPAGGYVLKPTTLAYDHGNEESQSVSVRELCAPVLHSGPMVVLLKDRAAGTTARDVMVWNSRERSRRLLGCRPWTNGIGCSGISI